MQIFYENASEIDKLASQLATCQSDAHCKAIMILAADGNQYAEKALSELLQNLKIPVFGGIFPGIMFENKVYDKGFVLVGFETEVHVEILPKISKKCTGSHILFKSNESVAENTKTIFAFVDGLTSGINDFINTLFINFGLEINYIGGGAGSLSLKQQPCVITNKGLLQDAAVIAATDLHSGIGVKHGWDSIAGPFKVTDVDGNLIKSLDYKPAAEVYKSVVESFSGSKIDDANFFSIAKSFPFGINKYDSEFVVRDPIAIVENNHLKCVAEVEKGAFLNILHGKNETLIQAAGEAIRFANLNNRRRNGDFTMFIDCISRSLLLDEEFDKELNDVYMHKVGGALLGALTIGEIANNGQDFLEFHNKTAVIGCF